MTNKEIIY